jgi:hypothetical protein
MADLVAKLIVSAILYLLSAWGLTALLSRLHDDWWSAVPLMDFGSALMVVLLVGVVIAPWRSSWKDDKK